jgi:hypothetical protein
LTNYRQHVDKQVHSLKFFKLLAVYYNEQVSQLLVVLLERAFHYFFAFEIGQTVYKFSTYLSTSLDYGFDEINEVFLIFFVQADDHSHINQIDNYLLFVFS